MIAKGTSRARARIEMLESRQLLSAAHPLTPAVMHTHPTPPDVVGTYEGRFSGTIGSSPTSDPVELVFSSESSTGKLSGAFISINTIIFSVGSINVKGKFSFHGSQTIVHIPETITVTGTANASGSAITGKFILKRKTNPATTIRATFSTTLFSRTVPTL